MMRYPEFFGAAPVITMRDPLAEFLGAMQDGLMEYRYANVVALAGHSCPTVAAAFLMTRAALNALYPDEVPRRGDIRVAVSGAQYQGTVGVTANVAGLITGAAGDGGFKGIGGHFKRCELLAFDAELNAEMSFTRADSGACVEVSADLSPVPMDARAGIAAAVSGWKRRSIGDQRIPPLVAGAGAPSVAGSQGRSGGDPGARALRPALACPRTCVAAHVPGCLAGRA